MSLLVSSSPSSLESLSMSPIKRALDASPLSSPEKKTRGTPVGIGAANLIAIPRRINFDAVVNPSKASLSSSPEDDNFFIPKASAYFAIPRRPAAAAAADEIDINDDDLAAEVFQAESFTRKIQRSPKKVVQSVVERMMKAVTARDYTAMRKIVIEATKEQKTPSQLFQEVKQQFMRASGQQAVCDQIDRILNYTRSIQAGLDEERPLTELQAAKIALVVQDKLSQAHEITYSRTSKILPRSVIVDPANGLSCVLSKKEALLELEGGFKKITSCTVVRHQPHSLIPTVQKTDFVRLVNQAGDDIEADDAEEEVEDMRNELELAKRFNNDVLLFVGYINKAHKAKFQWVEARYDSDLEGYLSFSRKGAKLSAGDTKQVLVEAAKMLVRMHAEGVVHNDLNGRNILIKRQTDGPLKVKITDFGKSYTHDTTYPRRDFLGYGSSAYTAPEYFVDGAKLTDELAQGKAEDMYALGCLIYRLIKGEEMPWASCVTRGVEGKTKALKQEAFEKQTSCYHAFSQEKFAENPFKARLLQVATALLNPNPGARPSATELLQFATSLEV